jgi:fructose-1,6-bisphosphatase/inositol monophosphatase family enzyme
MVWAGRGRGCRLNGAPVRVSSQPTLAGAYVSSSGYETWDDDALLRLKATGAHIRTWGDGYGYLLVAAGRIDAMVDPTAARYDLAPMPVILAEAGGAFSDYGGQPAADGGSGLATNGHLHQELLACLQR